MVRDTIDKATAIELAFELERARRVVLALNDPADLHIIEDYIAELEAGLDQRASTAELIA